MAASSRHLFAYVGWLLLAVLGTLAQAASVVGSYSIREGRLDTAWFMAILGAASGVYASGRPLRQRQPFFSSWCLIACAACGASGSLPFMAFATRWSSWTTSMCVALLSFSLAGAARSGFRAIVLPALKSGLAAYWVNPFRLLGFSVLSLLAAGLGARTGIAQQGAGVGIAWALAATWYPARHAFLYGSEPARSVLPWSAGIIGALLNGFVFALFGSIVPANEIAGYPSPIVFARDGKRRYVVTRGLSGYDLYADGQLEVSLLDEHRYFEALVHPAMLAAKRRDRVVVLEGGTGLAAREVLRYSDVDSLTIVATDPDLVGLATAFDWLRSRTHDSLSDDRIKLIFQEPAVWLSHEAPAFDVIIADFIVPLGYLGGKYYTRFMAERLRDRLQPDGALAVPALSHLENAKAHAAIVETFRATGLRVRAYHAPVPSLGAASFLVATTSENPQPRDPPDSTVFLNPGTLAGLTTFSNESTPEAARPMTLYRQDVVRLLREPGGP